MNFRIHNRRRNIIQDVESLTYFSEGIMVEHHMSQPTLLRLNMYHELLKGSGKLDQNGDEMFVGDIIQVEYGIPSTPLIGRVVFEEGSFIFEIDKSKYAYTSCNLYDLFTSDILIIGNWKTGVVNNENM